MYSIGELLQSIRGIGQERPYSAHETHAEGAEARGEDEEGAPGEGWEKPTVKRGLVERATCRPG